MWCETKRSTEPRGLAGTVQGLLEASVCSRSPGPWSGEAAPLARVTSQLSLLGQREGGSHRRIGEGRFLSRSSKWREPGEEKEATGCQTQSRGCPPHPHPRLPHFVSLWQAGRSGCWPRATSPGLEWCPHSHEGQGPSKQLIDRGCKVFGKDDQAWEAASACGFPPRTPG